VKALAWLSLGLTFGLAIILNAAMGVSVDYSSFVLRPLPLFAIAGLFLLGLHPNSDRFKQLYQFITLMVLSQMAAVMLHYGTTAVGMPVVDDKLAAIDLALGFHWVSFARFVNDYPWLALLLENGYSSFLVQPVVIILLLCLARQNERLYRFFAAYMLLTLLANAIYAFTPAYSAYHHFGIKAADLPFVDSAAAFQFLKHFEALRSGTFGTLVFPDVAGMMTFPSIHAATGLLCAWAVWRVPVAKVAFLVLNLFMAVSAITHGSHYLIDIIVGLSLVGLVVWLTTPLARLLDLLLSKATVRNTGSVPEPATVT
jgi:membrane-associated phospholipid phosphatase